jgi:hypothetical protein
VLHVYFSYMCVQLYLMALYVPLLSLLHPIEHQSTIILQASCNNHVWVGTASAFSVPYKQVYAWYRMYKKSRHAGHMKCMYVCRH